ncbi:uncharacterized protein LOC111124799 [Crassostrea virginica]|uniref:Uncharacterized protein LOC111124799 n=1 Tax=Crassostrea virginica TaxID=6565 RepID=A0A8B8D817_CRAVI|nr:uncharacterized protein LOC111124799 [Crassostrea virginica]XP_022323699.1 uncharacterized protein LOC111124800 [Crassostrea virginica]
MAKSRYPKLNWEYDFADTIRVICGLVPKKQPKVPDFNPWDWKSYKVENCSQDLINYQKLLAEKGLKDPWIRNEVHMFHLHTLNKLLSRWQFFGRMLLPGCIFGSFLAYIKINYFSYHDYEGREEKWKHYLYAKHH